MTLIIDKNFISKCNFKGRGGKENEVISCFSNNLIKENGILFNAGESKDLYNCLLTVINTNWQPNSYLPESYLSNKAILDKYHKFYSSITKSTGIK